MRRPSRCAYQIRRYSSLQRCSILPRMVLAATGMTASTALTARTVMMAPRPIAPDDAPGKEACIPPHHSCSLRTCMDWAKLRVHHSRPCAASDQASCCNFPGSRQQPTCSGQVPGAHHPQLQDAGRAAVPGEENGHCVTHRRIWRVCKMIDSWCLHEHDCTAIFELGCKMGGAGC